MVGLAEVGNADEAAVGAVAPAMIRAGENGRVAFVVAAHLHAAVAARIEEDVHLAGAVAAQQHRFLAHARDEEIAGVGDLALVPDKEPGAGKDLFLLLGVDLLVDEDLAADLPARHVDEAGAITAAARIAHWVPPGGHAKGAKALYGAKRL